MEQAVHPPGEPPTTNPKPMKKDTEKKDSRIQLFELFSVEELESRHEFHRRRRGGISRVNHFRETGCGFIPNLGQSPTF